MNQTPETLLPYDKPDSKHEQVADMFDAIAPEYDFMNRLMSFRQDIRWRRLSLRHLQALKPALILDVATGTGDFALDAFHYLQPERVLGIDLSAAMMEVGKQKAAAAGLSDRLHFEQADCLDLPYENNRFDAIVSAFGIRNFENILLGLQEMHRVLKPGGRLVLLELSRPTWFPANVLFNTYTKLFMPLAGRLFTKDGQAYRYLPASIQLVPQGKEMERLMREAGFAQTSHHAYSLGACTLYLGDKA